MRHERFLKIINLIILLLVMVAGLFLFFPFVSDYAGGSEEIPKIVFLPNPDFLPQPEKIVIRSLPIIPVIKPPLHLLFFGDLMLDRSVGTRLKNKKVDFLLAGLASSTDLTQFDLVGANLEGAVTNEGRHYAPEMGFDFAFLPSRIAELKKYNFSYFTIANNHITDQGALGLQETRANLDTLGVNYSGDADAHISENSLKLVTIKDKKIALIALSMVYRNFELASMKKIINEAHVEADWVIVNIHWGNEYQHDYSLLQQKIGRELIDGGADIIIGHHPHVVQGMEIYKKRPIFYSLGNFIFDQYFSSDTQEGLGIELELADDKIKIGIKPLSSELSVVNLMSEAKKEKFLENFSAWSKADQALKEQIKAQSIDIAK